MNKLAVILIALNVCAPLASAGEKCVLALQGNYIRLLHLAKASHLLSTADLEALAQLDRPANPLEGRVLNSTNLALTEAFQKLTGDQATIERWPSIQNEIAVMIQKERTDEVDRRNTVEVTPGLLTVKEIA